MAQFERDPVNADDVTWEERPRFSSRKKPSFGWWAKGLAFSIIFGGAAAVFLLPKSGVEKAQLAATVKTPVSTPFPRRYSWCRGFERKAFEMGVRIGPETRSYCARNP